MSVTHSGHFTAPSNRGGNNHSTMVERDPNSNRGDNKHSPLSIRGEDDQSRMSGSKSSNNKNYGNHSQHAIRDDSRNDEDNPKAGGHSKHNGHNSSRAHSMHGGMGGHENYTEKIFAHLDTIKKNLNFDVLAKLDKLYDKYKGENMSGGPGSPGRANREALRDEMISMQKKLFSKIDKEVLRGGGYGSLSPEMKDTLDAVAGWIKLGLHAGKNNDSGTSTHSMENSNSGPEGAAYVMAHLMQAGDDTKMDNFFRNGREINQSAMNSLNGASLYDLMKNNNGISGLYKGEGRDISTLWGASASVDTNSTQNIAAARSFFKKDYHTDYIY